MIHDAHMEVTCDGDGCNETVNVPMEFAYLDYTGKNGFYDHESSKIEATLIEDFEWVVVPDEDEDEDSKHFCDAGCISQAD